MRTLKVLTSILTVIIFAGCARHPEPVAMNMYTPNGDAETVSGVSVVITKEMIESTRARMHKRSNIK